MERRLSCQSPWNHWVKVCVSPGRKIYGEEHGDTALSYQNLARILLSQGKIKEADFFNRRALDCSLRVHGDVNDLTIQCILMRAMIEVELDNATEANHLCDKVLADIRTFYDVGDRYSTLSYISIAYLMHGLG
ncbi:MAG: tetratricopeptide repeat protein, partial [Pirellulaceae bacterium]